MLHSITSIRLLFSLYNLGMTGLFQQDMMDASCKDGRLDSGILQDLPLTFSNDSVGMSVGCERKEIGILGT